MGNATLQKPCAAELDTCVFVLGAKDPEMDRIEQILSEHQLPFVHAMSSPTERVNPRSAYTTDYPLSLGSLVPLFVECEPTSVQSPFTIIDHHRIGDTGYDAKPEAYKHAASIGQLCGILGVELSAEDKILAAMDHCFAAAFRGKCPEVSMGDVWKLKINTIVKSHGVPHAHVNEKIRSNIAVIEEADEIVLGNAVAKDLRNIPLGLGNSLDHLTMVTARAFTGHPLLLSEVDQAGGAKKITFRSDNPDDIEYFMTSWAASNGCVEVYGVPNRGYAGAYKESVS